MHTFLQYFILVMVTLLWTLGIYFNVFNVLCFCSCYFILVLVTLLWTLEIYFNVSIMSFAFVQDAGVHALSNVCHVDVERISKRKPGEVVCTQNPFFSLNTDYSPGLACIYWHSKLISFFIFAC